MPVGEVFAGSARLQWKTFPDELLQDFQIEEANRPIGTDVLGMVAPVADEAGGSDHPHGGASGTRDGWLAAFFECHRHFDEHERTEHDLLHEALHRDIGTGD